MLGIVILDGKIKNHYWLELHTEIYIYICKYIYMQNDMISELCFLKHSRKKKEKCERVGVYEET